MNNTQRIDTPENLNELKLEINRQSFKRKVLERHVLTVEVQKVYSIII